MIKTRLNYLANTVLYITAVLLTQQFKKQVSTL